MIGWIAQRLAARRIRQAVRDGEGDFRDRSAMRGGSMIQVEGVVQHEGGVVNVLATRVTPLGQQ